MPHNKGTKGSLLRLAKLEQKILGIADNKKNKQQKDYLFRAIELLNTKALEGAASVANEKGKGVDYLFDAMYWTAIESLCGENKKEAFEALRGMIRGHADLAMGAMQKINPEAIDRILKNRKSAVEMLNKVEDELHQLFMENSRDTLNITLPDFFLFYVDLVNRRFASEGLYEFVFTDPEIEYSMNTDTAESYLIEISRNICYELLYNESNPCRHELIIGIPSGVAYRVGMSYYRGDYLELDHEKAYYWLGYAAITGDFRAKLATFLFYGGFDLYESNAFENYFKIVSNVAACACSAREYDALQPSISIDYVCDGVVRHYDRDLLCNLVNLIEFFVQSGKSSFVEYFLSPGNWLIFELCHLFENNKRSDIEPEVYAALVVYYELVDDYLKNQIRESLVNCGFLKKNLQSDDYVVKELLNDGVKAENYACQRAYMKSRSFSFSDDALMPVMESLAKKGDGRAAFGIGARYWNGENIERNKELATLWWQKAADMGYGFALFNSALSELLAGNNTKASMLAQKAAEDGVVFSFYILYRAERQRNSKLAYTYLRFAAEYLFPAAVAELELTRQQEIYEPLPFMQTIEKIESLARYSLSACVFMSYLYDSSGLLPEDQFMSMKWIRRGVELGDDVSFHELNQFYNECFMSRRECYFVRSMQTALQDMQKYFTSSAGTVDSNASKVKELIKKCYEQLSNGSTRFERSLFINSVEHGFWARNGIDISLDKAIATRKDEAYFSALKMYNELLSSQRVGELGRTLTDGIQERVDNIELSQLSADDKRPVAVTSLALTCIRGMTCAPDFDRFKRFSIHGKNCGEPFCQVMAEQIFDVFRQDSQFQVADSKAMGNVLVTQIAQ